MKIIMMLLFSMFIYSQSSFAGGEKIFKKKGCVACHHATIDKSSSGLGPSIKQIASAYDKDPNGLLKFLQGKGEARIDKKKFKLLMQMQLMMIKNLSSKEMQDLRDYILE